MHYLVTGGAGFIGSHLVERLLGDGHHVRIIDNFTTGKYENIRQGAEVFPVDFTNLEAIRPAFEGVDGVFHMGAKPSVQFSIAHPIESTHVNVIGTLNILVASRDAGVKRVVYSASSSAYGIQPELPQRPEMEPNPLSLYALQKHMSEKFAQQFAQHYGLETVSLRYFNVYGPRMNDMGAYVPVFILLLRQKKEGTPLTIYGDGEQTRDFTHVSDVVAANIAAMTSLKVGSGEILNVGAGGRTTINAVVKIIGGDVIYFDPRPGDIPHSQADITRTKALLDWEPKVEFMNGFRQLLRDEGIEPTEIV